MSLSMRRCFPSCQAIICYFLHKNKNKNKQTQAQICNHIRLKNRHRKLHKSQHRAKTGTLTFNHQIIWLPSTDFWNSAVNCPKEAVKWNAIPTDKPAVKFCIKICWKYSTKLEHQIFCSPVLCIITKLIVEKLKQENACCVKNMLFSFVLALSLTIKLLLINYRMNEWMKKILAFKENEKHLIPDWKTVMALDQLLVVNVKRSINVKEDVIEN